MLYIYFTNGGSGYLYASDPNKNAILTMAMTALVASRTVTIRYQANGVACTAGSRNDVVGLYLN